MIESVHTCKLQRATSPKVARIADFWFFGDTTILRCPYCGVKLPVPVLRKPKKVPQKPIDEGSLTDFRGSLGELHTIVNSLINKHGIAATITFEPSANHVTASITKW